MNLINVLIFFSSFIVGTVIGFGILATIINYFDKKEKEQEKRKSVDCFDVVECDVVEKDIYDKEFYLGDVAPYLRQGYRVAKTSWQKNVGSEVEYLFMEYGELYCRDRDGRITKLSDLVPTSWILHKDWKIVDHRCKSTKSQKQSNNLLEV